MMLREDVINEYSQVINKETRMMPSTNTSLSHGAQVARNSSEIPATRPCIVDVEASGFGRGSYPIEIAVALPDGTIVSHLIKPMECWKHWDNEAEALHGISYQQLREEGMPADKVADWLNEILNNIGIVYSDSWGYDSSWIARLFNDTKILQGFRIESLRSILTESQLHGWDDVRQMIEDKDNIRRHRAAEDVKMLQKTFDLTHE